MVVHINTVLEHPSSGGIHSNQANNAFDGKHKCSSIITKIGATCTDSDAYDKQKRATGTFIEHECYLVSDISFEERLSATRPTALCVAEVRIHPMSPKAAYTFDIKLIIQRARAASRAPMLLIGKK